jgi:coenzyme F420-reducing hydrogenase alpha subunit
MNDLDEFKEILETSNETYWLFQQYLETEKELLISEQEMHLSRYVVEDHEIFSISTPIEAIHMIDYKDWICENFMMYDFTTDTKVLDFKIPDYMNSNTKHVLLLEEINNISIMYNTRTQNFNLCLTIKYE